MSKADDVTNERLRIEMNKNYAVVRDGNKVRVLMFDKQITHLDGYSHTREVPMLLDFENFRNLHCNKFVTVTSADGKTTTTPLGKWWLSHRHRQEYSGIIFKPNCEEVIDGKKNLWRGWGVEPKAGDWSLMKEHIRVVLAANDVQANRYIIRWLAWCVQHPDRRAEVSLVFKGGKGVGKGTLGNTMCHIFGQHGVHISDAKHLVGFNAHLRDACFLFADEAYWPGDKSAEGNLKRLITEPSLLIEGKGKDAIMVPNMLHVMMASNEDWIIPAGESERRYVIYEVDPCHIQEEVWFDAIYRQMKNGGYSAMLQDLLNYDLGDWHPRKIGDRGGNGAMLDQQRRSLDPFDSWWVELLESGTLMGCDPQCPESAVSGSYREGNHYHVGLLEYAHVLEPRLRQRNVHLLGRYLAKQKCSNVRKVMRRQGWTFPPLSQLRREWERKYPDWTWRNPDLTDWIAEDRPEDGDAERTDIPF